MKHNFPHTAARPLSWSAISSFAYDPEQWFEKYVMGKVEKPNKEMIFGKMVGEKLASDPTYLPEVPRLGTYEKELRVMFNKIPLIGFLDNSDEIEKLDHQEFKTGKKPWTQKRANEHGQITLYSMLRYITDKIPPEEQHWNLIWLPTCETGAFEIEFVPDMKPVIFTTKRTMADLLKFGAYIMKTTDEMRKYCANHL